MQITVTTESGAVFPLEVSLELTLQDLKSIVEIEAAINASQIILYHDMVPMTEEDRNLGEYNIQDGDIIMVSSSSLHLPEQSHQNQTLPQLNWGDIQVPPHDNRRVMPHPPHPQTSTDMDDPDNIRRHLLSHPSELELLRQRNPLLAQAVEDPQVFRLTLERQMREKSDMERERIRMINADPFDAENQNKIAQEIEQKNIEENMVAAMEYTPESFSRIVMLYLSIKVNGVVVKALVDSGAASTIMSDKCAKRCGIMRLVDRRFAGVAVGVGRQNIIGKVHLGTIQIGEDFLTSSFQVLEAQTEDMLLGLDMLRRHQCCIDLKINVLHIGTTGNKASFLSESELKEKEEMRRKQQELLMLEESDAEMAKTIAASSQQQHKRPKITDASSPPPSSSNSVGISGPSHQPTLSDFPESSIQRIVSVGFSREEAVSELRRCDGKVELALTTLLARSIKL